MFTQTLMLEPVARGCNLRAAVSMSRNISKSLIVQYVILYLVSGIDEN